MPEQYREKAEKEKSGILTDYVFMISNTLSPSKRKYFFSYSNQKNRPGRSCSLSHIFSFV